MWKMPAYRPGIPRCRKEGDTRKAAKAIAEVTDTIDHCPITFINSASGLETFWRRISTGKSCPGPIASQRLAARMVLSTPSGNSGRDKPMTMIAIQIQMGMHPRRMITSVGKMRTNPNTYLPKRPKKILLGARGVPRVSSALN